MRVVIGYCDRDEQLAAKLAAWIRELGPYPGHKLLVLRDITSNIRPFANVGFDKVDEVEIRDDADRKWPESCNNAFGHAARYIEYSAEAQPWLWIEPDVVPLRSGWLNSIMMEYQQCGRPFLGDFVSVHTPELDVPDHMSGVAVYPGSMTSNAGVALITREYAWDVAAAYQIVPRMATSKLILHNWKHPPFPDYAAIHHEIYSKKPDCVLFHADKSGTLIDLLRQQKAGVVECAPAAGASSRPRAVEAAATPACDILIKSYPADFDRLKYCLRSIDKFAKGFRSTVLVIPRGTRLQLQTALAGIDYLDFNTPIEVDEHGEGYMFQQAVKAAAHEFSDADYILHIDSDTMFTKPVVPQTFFHKGKIVWLYTPYTEIVTPWQKITEHFMDEAIDYEFMRRLPLMMPRWLHEGLAKFCFDRHRMRLIDYVVSRPSRGFSEFNALGAYAFTRHKEKFVWLNTTVDPIPDTVALQRWTGDPFDDVVKDKCEEMLSVYFGPEFDPVPKIILSGGEGERQPVGSSMDQALAPPSQISTNGAAEPPFNGEYYVADGAPKVPAGWKINPEWEALEKLDKQRARAAHARAVAAANRAAGIKPRTRGKGKKKKARV